MSSSSGKINLDALLSIAEQSDEDKEYEIKDEIELFIQKHNLKEGNTFNWNWALLWNYNNETLENKLSQKEFDKKFQRHFRRKLIGSYDRTHGHYIYSLDRELKVPGYVKYKYKRKTKKRVTKNIQKLDKSEK